MKQTSSDKKNTTDWMKYQPDRAEERSATLEDNLKKLPKLQSRETKQWNIQKRS